MRIPILRAATATIASLALATIALPATSATLGRAFPGLESVGGAPAAATRHYRFHTLNDAADPTFNQLLGINDNGEIAGYYGSGNPGDPNVGYVVSKPYHQSNFKVANYPGAVQTQEIGINSKGDTAGFYVDGSGNNIGFVRWQGTFNQLLGINDNGIAAGFYTDAKGVNHGYLVNQATSKYQDVAPNLNNVTAAGINNMGMVTGFYTASSGVVTGFVIVGGKLTSISYPGAIATTPFGINDDGTIVGAYSDKSGASHGFVVFSPQKHAQFEKIDDPDGVGTTVVNGINVYGDLVGFYTDKDGNTDGFVADTAKH
jgi:uncharacterized membrane protein